jgi:hypothetical protein
VCERLNVSDQLLDTGIRAGVGHSGDHAAVEALLAPLTATGSAR